ncbi:polysaccharide biosynthesis protein [Caldinitratiruptor microaerophilus]|uniref:Polysaccharide biosynthesis protein n=1 Tax=Caldinitratiruptor microaerophilus TaxID=671077 RepID=A0AA35G5Y4_9FIRM|nr:polysaccharide biosynthesis protein [Caldinitratiruptor microaerophilus]
MNGRSITRRVLLALVDAALVNVSVVLALLIRFDGRLPDRYVYAYFPLVAVARTVLAVAGFYALGLYHSLWRYASVREFLGVARAVSLNALPFALMVFTRVVPGFPRSVVILSWVFDVALVAGVRLLARLWRETHAARQTAVTADTGRRVLIVGAGEAGTMVARELVRHEELRYVPVGFVDDDPHKQGMRVAGLPVLGTRGVLTDLIERHRIDDIIIAMPSAPASVIRDIHERCSGKVRLRTLPGVYELIDGRVTIQQIRDIQLEDLLGRREIRLDLDQIASYLSGERVLVTGAGGSIGSELCRQVARFQPTELLLLGNEENSIFEIQTELSFQYPDLQVTPIIANIRDGSRMNQIYATYRPTVVFHAAAHKHVPLMEAHPAEAVKNNVTGTRICAELAEQYGVKRFVLISTDKAVNPTSVMGATKRVAEMIIQQLNGRGTRFMAVRFGNVLGSRGSVVPLFREQIARGGPVTVTHPDVQRYFMTIPEAVSLVIQAGAMGLGGEVFVLDMGEPVKIADLARNLIRLSGREPDRDIPIVFIGLRPGEKLFEELLTSEEGTTATQHTRIYVAREAVTAIHGDFRKKLCALEAAAETGDEEQILRWLRELIPTYRPARSNVTQAPASAMV